MAEAFPEEPSTAELPPDGSKETISVLLLASRWQFDRYGLSTVNKSLVNNLRLVDPERKTIKIACAVVEEEGKIYVHGKAISSSNASAGSYRFYNPRFFELETNTIGSQTHPRVMFRF